MWAEIVWNRYSSEDQVQIKKEILSRDNNGDIRDTWCRKEIVTQLGIRTIILTLSSSRIEENRGKCRYLYLLCHSMAFCSINTFPMFASAILIQDKFP